MSKRLLNSTKVGQSTTSLGNFCQCSVAHTVQNCFLIFRWEPPALPCIHCLLNWLWAPQKVPSSVFTAVALWVFISIDKVSTPSLLQVDQSQLSQPFFIKDVSSSFALSFLGLSPVCPCLSHTGGPELDIALQAWPQQKQGITSFNLLAILCLMQVRIVLDCLSARARCWIMFNLVPTRTPGLFLQVCFPAGWSPASPGTWGCSSPGAGLCPSPC